MVSMKDSYYEIIDNALVLVTLMPAPIFGDNDWIVTHVATQRKIRGKGHASRIFQSVLADADAEQATLVLTIDPDPPEFGGITYDQLEAWYERLGFKWEPNGEWMKRTPNAR